MQTKKLSVQNAIIDAAAEEFFKYGFRGASMRRMAKNAGTGIGNFYNYFKGKNEIFAYIVSEQYAKTQIIISRTVSEKPEIDFNSIRDIRLFCQEFRHWLMRAEPLFNRKMFLLLARSEGTPFQSVKDEIVTGLTQIFTSFFDFRKNAEIVPPSLFFEHIINNLIQIAENQYKSAHVRQIAFNHFYSSCLGYILCSINI